MDEISDNELMAARLELQSLRTSSEQQRPINRQAPKTQPRPVKTKYVPHVLKVIDATEQISIQKQYSQKAAYDQQLIDTNFQNDTIFDPVFGQGGIIQNFKTPFQSTASDAVFLYVSAAAQAIQSIEQVDPSAAKTLVKVIDFLTSEARTNPKIVEELVQQRDLIQQQLKQATSENKLLLSRMKQVQEETNEAKEETQNIKIVISNQNAEMERIQFASRQALVEQERVQLQLKQLQEKYDKISADRDYICNHSNGQLLDIQHLRDRYEEQLVANQELYKQYDDQKHIAEFAQQQVQEIKDQQEGLLEKEHIAQNHLKDEIDLLQHQLTKLKKQQETLYITIQQKDKLIAETEEKMLKYYVNNANGEPVTTSFNFSYAQNFSKAQLIDKLDKSVQVSLVAFKKKENQYKFEFLNNVSDTSDEIDTKPLKNNTNSNLGKQQLTMRDEELSDQQHTRKFVDRVSFTEEVVTRLEYEQKYNKYKQKIVEKNEQDYIREKEALKRQSDRILKDIETLLGINIQLSSPQKQDIKTVIQQYKESYIGDIQKLIDKANNKILSKRNSRNSENKQIIEREQLESKQYGRYTILYQQEMQDIEKEETESEYSDSLNDSLDTTKETTNTNNTPNDNRSLERADSNIMTIPEEESDKPQQQHKGPQNSMSSFVKSASQLPENYENVQIRQESGKQHSKLSEQVITQQLPPKQIGKNIPNNTKSQIQLAESESTIKKRLKDKVKKPDMRSISLQTAPMVTKDKQIQVDNVVNVHLTICKNCQKKIDKDEINNNAEQTNQKLRVRNNDMNNTEQVAKDVQQLTLEQQRLEKENLEKNKQRKIKLFMEARDQVMQTYKRLIAARDQLYMLKDNKAKRPQYITLNDLQLEEILETEIKQLTVINAKAEQEFIALQEIYVDVSNHVITVNNNVNNHANTADEKKKSDSKLQQMVTQKQLEQEQVILKKDVIMKNLYQYISQEDKQSLQVVAKEMQVSPDKPVVKQGTRMSNLSFSTVYQQSTTQNESTTTINENKLNILIQAAQLSQQQPQLMVSPQLAKDLNLTVKSSDGTVSQLVTELMNQINDKKGTIRRGHIAGQKRKVEQAVKGGEFYRITTNGGVKNPVQKAAIELIEKKNKLKKRVKQANKKLFQELLDMQKNMAKLTPEEEFGESPYIQYLLDQKIPLLSSNIKEQRPVNSQKEITRPIKRKPLNISMIRPQLDKDLRQVFLPNQIKFKSITQQDILITELDIEPIEMITQEYPLSSLSSLDLVQLNKRLYYLTGQEQKDKVPVIVNSTVTWVRADSESSQFFEQFQQYTRQKFFQIDIGDNSYFQTPPETKIKTQEWMLNTLEVLSAQLLQKQVHTYNNFVELLVKTFKREYNSLKIVNRLIWHLYVGALFWSQENSEIELFKMLLTGEIGGEYYQYAMYIQNYLKIHFKTQMNEIWSQEQIDLVNQIFQVQIQKQMTGNGIVLVLLNKYIQSRREYGTLVIQLFNNEMNSDEIITYQQIIRILKQLLPYKSQEKIQSQLQAEKITQYSIFTLQQFLNVVSKFDFQSVQEDKLLTDSKNKFEMYNSLVINSGITDLATINELRSNVLHHINKRDAFGAHYTLQQYANVILSSIVNQKKNENVKEVKE
ncbi:Conserved_hypothetical protein [Hexamita inflata]|uniref:Uncharacterized protein n=1 Tax=Hexamita inflata TaxID=28002 RepID=A0AA86PD63_9EUKA|nr:Conserved hypothetical protein [Hexamita inflata]